MDTGLGAKLVALKVVLGVVLTCFSGLSSNSRHGGALQHQRPIGSGAEGKGHGRQLVAQAAGAGAGAGAWG